MLNVYSLDQEIVAGGLVQFTNVALSKGGDATLSGAATIQLNKCGVYSVHLVLTGLPAAAGDATVSMTKDGVIQPSAVATVPDAIAAVGVTLPIETLVQVPRNNGPCCCQSPVVLQFISTGLTEADAQLVITKVC